MTLKDIREWLKPQVSDLKGAYIGKIDASKENIIGVYGRTSGNSKVAIGGLDNTSSWTKQISILVHWSKNCDTTEVKAKEIYDLLQRYVCQPTNVGGVDSFFKLLSDEPVFVGADDNDVFEYIIDAKIIYERG